MPFCGMVRFRDTRESLRDAEALIERCREKWETVTVRCPSVECLFVTSEESSKSVDELDGLWIAFDGRVDNYGELADALHDDLGLDNENALKALLTGYRRWGGRLVEKIVGDWAMVIYDSVRRELQLARDYPGARSLFYSRCAYGVLWSTDLDVLAGYGRFSEIDEEYCMHFISSVSGSLRSPYRRIRQLRAGKGILVSEDRFRSISGYSLIDRHEQTFLRDEEAQKAFGDLLRQAVRDRLTRSRSVAQLSGGYDSSSIVCLASRLVEEGSLEPESLTTVTVHFDDDTANLDNEYAAVVDKHVPFQNFILDQKEEDQWFPPIERLRRTTIPIEPAYLASGLERLFKRNSAALLVSGEGGDLVGAANVRPHTLLGDLWRSRRFVRFSLEVLSASRALHRAPWRLFMEDVVQQRTLASAALKIGTYRGEGRLFRPRAPWIRRFSPPDTSYAQAELDSMTDSQLAYCLGVEWFHQMLARDQFGFLRPARATYPFLDRRLVEFSYSLPIYQKVSASNPRMLHRQAMWNVVPKEVLARRRKSRISGAIIREIRRSWRVIGNVLDANSRLAEYGIVDLEGLRLAVREVRDGIDIRGIMPVYRALVLELWLRRYEIRHGGE